MSRHFPSVLPSKFCSWAQSQIPRQNPKKEKALFWEPVMEFAFAEMSTRFQRQIFDSRNVRQTENGETQRHGFKKKYENNK